MPIEKQPIETAPKDGTWILVFGGRATEESYNPSELPEKDLCRSVVARWDPDKKNENEDDGGWVYAFWDGAWYSVYDQPTHWASLD